MILQTFLFYSSFPFLSEITHTFGWSFSTFIFFLLYTSSGAEPMCGRGQTEPVCDTMLAATRQVHRVPQNHSTWCLVEHGNKVMFALIAIPRHSKYSKPPPCTFRLSSHLLPTPTISAESRVQCFVKCLPFYSYSNPSAEKSIICVNIF